ncbi:NrsF family protein [Hyphomicrobium sp. MC8b]|uniref:NrsF family protein n=1 Tax=Hyphomicrobium sp. MC8b TaxID=300273 RepID=UPI00391893E4
MRTEQLITSLVADLPTSPGSVARIITASLLLSIIFSLTVMVLWLGLRPELGTAMHSAPFWIKAGYTFMIGTAGLFALERLGRPGAKATSSFALLSAIFAIVALSAGMEFFMSPPDERSQLWLGSSSSFCPWAIVTLSIPLLVAAFLALRQLAPTHYAVAGAAAGFMAGGYGACIYSLHCTEYGIPFLATWYSLGVLIVVGGGMLLSGLLRW